LRRRTNKEGQRRDEYQYQVTGILDKAKEKGKEEEKKKQEGGREGRKNKEKNKQKT
jgi:parvulin-like peptidyl-prolyl isomerase